MLGRLATWLRILGYDCAYERDIEDERLIERAAREGRVLLTRDRLLLKRRKVRRLTRLMVGHDGFRDQLVQVIRAFSLDRVRAGTRCACCNLPLEPVSREAVRAVVPFFVAATQSDFKRCPACRRVYWPATHRRHMADEIDELFKRAGLG